MPESRSPQPDHSAPLIKMKGIGKTFPGVRALSQVDFALLRGEVHAIMGENGAGKSTLIKILTGAYTPDSGTILLDGRPIAPTTPLDALRLGIGAIHQEVDLLPYLSVAENIFIGRQPRKLGRIDWKQINGRATQLMQALGIDIDVTLPLASFPAAIRQMVSIARATDTECRVLVMDEPTSSLDQSEVEQLFQVIRRLKSGGVGIVFITHFLDQVYEIADRITVLRNGESAGEFATASLDKLDLVAHMLGRSRENAEMLLSQHAAQTPRSGTRTYFSASGLGRANSIRPCDIEIKEGEVMGLAGLLGSGRTELARILFGIDQPTSGRLAIDGTVIGKMSPRLAISLGMGFSPEDRRTEGIVPDLSLRENIVLAVQRRMSKLGLVSRKKQQAVAARYVDQLGISAASLDQPVRNLSGGNQQKVILARWLALEPRLLILDEPTRGIDVGAKSEIENLIQSLSDDGMGVLFISSALEEVVRRSHRVAVMRDRAKVAELSGDQINEQAIMETIARGDTHA